MVLVNVAEVGALPHSHELAPEVIVSGDFPGGQVLLVVLVDVEDGLTVLGLLHPVAVTIIDETGPAIPVGRPDTFVTAANGRVRTITQCWSPLVYLRERCSRI